MDEITREPERYIKTGDNHDGTPESWARRCGFLAAFAKAQANFAPIEKNRSAKIRGETKKGDPFEYTFHYADLKQVHTKTRPALAANGMSTSTQIEHDGTGVEMTVMLSHQDGYERWSRVRVNYGDDIKKFGGNVTYMRRYLLTSLLEVAADDDADDSDEDDDDGGRWSAPPPPPSQRRSAPARQQGGNVASPAPAPEAPAGVATAGQISLLRGKLKAMEIAEASVIESLGLQRLEEMTEEQFRAEMVKLRKG